MRPVVGSNSDSSHTSTSPTRCQLRCANCGRSASSVGRSTSQRPPGFSECATSFACRRFSSALNQPKLPHQHSAASKRPRHGSSRMSPTRSSTETPRAAALLRASSTSSGWMSTPVTRMRRAASSTAMRPSPHGASSTSAPGASSSVRATNSASFADCSGVRASRCTASHGPEKKSCVQSPVPIRRASYRAAPPRGRRGAAVRDANARDTLPPMPRPDNCPTAAELFGKAATVRGTRDRLLHAALDLFYTYGFHEVGLDRVLDVVGVTKTTFYKHFESRDHLIMEAVALRNDWETDAFAKCVRAKAGHDPRAMLLAMFDVMDEWFNEPAYKQCIFISACAEYPWRDHPVHRAAAAHYERSKDEIASIASAAGAKDPAALARTWVLLLQGAVTARMTMGDDDAARRAKEIAEAALDAQTRAPARRSKRG